MGPLQPYLLGLQYHLVYYIGYEIHQWNLSWNEVMDMLKNDSRP